MATNKIKDVKRMEITEQLVKYFMGQGEDAMIVKGNVMAFPIVLDGEDEWIEVTVKIPTGSRDGDPYDGYALNEEYRMKQEEKDRKNKEAAERKARKIEADKLRRAKAKEIAEKKNN